MFGLGIWELLVILAIILILFGVKRIPQLGTSLGAGVKNFSKSLKDDDSDSSGEKESENSDSSK